MELWSSEDELWTWGRRGNLAMRTSSRKFSDAKAYQKLHLQKPSLLTIDFDPAFRRSGNLAKEDSQTKRYRFLQLRCGILASKHLSALAFVKLFSGGIQTESALLR